MGRPMSGQKEDYKQQIGKPYYCNVAESRVTCNQGDVKFPAQLGLRA
jgi:hypothetical protein